MRVVEIRDLDGPNIFLLQPALKLELETSDADLTADAIAGLDARLEPLGISDEARPGGLDALGELLVDITLALHRRAGAPEPDVTWKRLETPGHVALAFAWSRRRFAKELAAVVAALALGDESAPAAAAQRLQVLHDAEPGPGDAPEMIRDADRNIPVIGITGTNGKTTTTRLTAHILRQAGRKVGWSSSTGVFIEGEQVMDGDMTGPTGARRVLAEPGLDVAVLETARGGILLRGLGTESNDVSVFINVSGDHLDLHGVRTVEGLAEVKATVVRVTRPEGFAVLNADDPLVRGTAGSIRASPFWISKVADNPTVAGHVAAGGHALFVRDDAVIYSHRGSEDALISVSDVQINFGGRAPHMIENALCAAGACLGLGLEPAAVRDGLRSFRNTADQNAGRLNVFDVDGVVVIVDYAHNEAGLANLLAFATAFRSDDARLTTIIGTAGDRTDGALREIGRLAASRSDRVIVKETTRYRRGRNVEEMNRLFAEGIAAGGDTPHHIEPNELHALAVALADASPGDVIAMMCIEQVAEIQAELATKGRSMS